MLILALLWFNIACGTIPPPKASCATDEEKTALKVARDAWYSEVLNWRKEGLSLAFEMQQLQQYPQWMEMADWFKGEIGRRYVEQRTQESWNHYLAKVYWSHRWEKNGPEVYDRTWDLARRGLVFKNRRDGLNKQAGSFRVQDTKFATCPGLRIGETAQSLEMHLRVWDIETKQLEPEEITIIDRYFQVTGFCALCSSSSLQK